MRSLRTIRENESAVSPVIATLLTVAIVVVAVAVLYIVAFAPSAPAGGDIPTVTFDSLVTSSGGNVTVQVASAAPGVAPANFKVNLDVSSQTGVAVAMPTTSGEFVSLVVNATTYRIYWTDTGGGGTVNSGDRFAMTGNGVPLPSGSFTFMLFWRDGSQLAQAAWTLAPPVGNKPVLTFSAASLNAGNATIAVAGTSQAVSPSNYRVNLETPTGILGTAIAMPATSGAFVNVVVGGTSYRVYWTDVGGDGTVNAGDQFRVTGNGIPLMAARAYTLYLLWGDGSTIQSASWQTP